MSSIDFVGGLRYSTLSHIWGDGKFLKLKHENLVAFQDHIPLFHDRAELLEGSGRNSAAMQSDMGHAKKAAFASHSLSG